VQLIEGAGLGETIIFILLAGGALAGALLTVTRRNPITAVMSLVGTFFALAGIYATLDAHFVAVLQILVYAGAIMVLFIFVVMILNREEITPVSFRGIVLRFFGVLAGVYVAYLSSWVVWNERATMLLKGSSGPPPPGFGGVSSVGMEMFKTAAFPFEAISLLLLVAVVGGLILSRSLHQQQVADATAQRIHDIRVQSHPEIKLLPGGGPAPEDHPAAHH
jgi:NADH-quinone oxidoreductase subunit J